MTMISSAPIRGFTLIETLMVCAIILIMVGMVMPIVSLCQTRAMKTNTQVVLKKVDTALRMFKTDFGIYPYQASYPDLDNGGTIADSPNRLYYQIGTTLADSDRSNLSLDMNSAGNAFAYNWLANSWSEGPQPSRVTYRIADLQPSIGQADEKVAILLNRMAQERARLAVLSGNLAQHGPLILNGSGQIVIDRTAATVLPSGYAASAGSPGWASDYLAGDIDPAFIRGQTICDAWRNPLVYINQTIPGIRGTSAWIMQESIYPFDSRFYGLGYQGFDPTTGPVTSLKAAGRSILLCNGRIPISSTDAGDGSPTPTDPAYFPDSSRPLHSDMRFYCGTGYQTEFELWSAGADGHMSFMRDDPANADNISVVDYNKDLQ